MHDQNNISMIWVIADTQFVPTSMYSATANLYAL
jgi:hypothetical protein